MATMLYVTNYQDQVLRESRLRVELIYFLSLRASAIQKILLDAVALAVLQCLMHRGTAGWGGGLVVLNFNGGVSSSLILLSIPFGAASFPIVVH